MADTPKMYRVYSIVPRAKQDDYWLNIGVAFPHDDGQGLNVMLQSLPRTATEGDLADLDRRRSAHALSPSIRRLQSNEPLDQNCRRANHRSAPGGLHFAHPPILPSAGSAAHAITVAVAAVDTSHGTDGSYSAG